jgi:hypothetical protein
MHLGTRCRAAAGELRQALVAARGSEKRTISGKATGGAQGGPPGPLLAVGGNGGCPAWIWGLAVAVTFDSPLQ